MLCCKPLGIFASVFNIFLMYAYICMYVHTANIYFYIRFLMTIQFLKTNIRFLSSITIMIFPFNSQSILLSLRYSVLQAVFIDCITGSPYPLASGWISKRYTGRRLEEKMGSILGCFFNLGLGGRISVFPLPWCHLLLVSETQLSSYPCPFRPQEGYGFWLY